MIMGSEQVVQVLENRAHAERRGQAEKEHQLREKDLARLPSNPRDPACRAHGHRTLLHQDSEVNGIATDASAGPVRQHPEFASWLLCVSCYLTPRLACHTWSLPGPAALTAAIMRICS